MLAELGVPLMMMIVVRAVRCIWVLRDVGLGDMSGQPMRGNEVRPHAGEVPGGVYRTVCGPSRR